LTFNYRNNIDLEIDNCLNLTPVVSIETKYFAADAYFSTTTNHRPASVPMPAAKHAFTHRSSPFFPFKVHE